LNNKSPYIIETERLLLRGFNLDDAEDLFVLNSDSEVIKYTGDLAFRDVNDAKQFIKTYSTYNKNGYGRWAVVLKPELEFIGWCGIKLNEENQIDLGFRFFRSKWGKGYATESSKAVLKYAFETLQLNEIVGRVIPENIGSVKVLEKIGMYAWKTGQCHGLENARYYKINIEQFNMVKP
jgi:RimJ/RimL family protein N-acetyltransferase